MRFHEKVLRGELILEKEKVLPETGCRGPNFMTLVEKEIKTLREEVARLASERKGLQIANNMLQEKINQWEAAERAREREEAALAREINELMEENMKLQERIK